jgi:hypothetical protein
MMTKRQKMEEVQATHTVTKRVPYAVGGGVLTLCVFDFLTLEETCRMESVSKTWQTTVHRHQTYHRKHVIGKNSIIFHQSALLRRLCQGMQTLTLCRGLSFNPLIFDELCDAPLLRHVVIYSCVLNRQKTWSPRTPSSSVWTTVSSNTSIESKWLEQTATSLVEFNGCITRGDMPTKWASGTLLERIHLTNLVVFPTTLKLETLLHNHPNLKQLELCSYGQLENLPLDWGRRLDSLDVLEVHRMSYDRIRVDRKNATLSFFDFSRTRRVEIPPLLHLIADKDQFQQLSISSTSSDVIRLVLAQMKVRNCVVQSRSSIHSGLTSPLQEAQRRAVTRVTLDVVQGTLSKYVGLALDFQLARLEYVGIVWMYACDEIPAAAVNW